MKLKSKMLIFICGVALVAFAATIYAIASMATGHAREDALHLVEEMAFRYGGEVEKEIGKAINAASTISHMLGNAKKESKVLERSKVVDMLYGVAELNREFFGVWAVWHPDSYDGPDADADTSQAGTAENGQFRPICHRYSGNLKITSTGFQKESDPVGSWYWKPYRTEKIFITSPTVYEFDGKPVMMISICIPIKNSGKTVGVAGVDFGMEKMKGIVSAIKPLETGLGYILFADSSVVAHPDETLVGKKIVPLNVEEAVAQGRVLTEIGETKGISGESMAVYVPIQLGEQDEKWSLAVAVAMDKVLEKAAGLRNMSLLLGTVSLLVLFVIVYGIASFIIIRPINRVIEGLTDIAQGEGDLTKRLEILSGDEIGILSQCFNTFMEKLHLIIGDVTGKNRLIGTSSEGLNQISSDMASLSSTTSERTGLVANEITEMTGSISSIAAAIEETANNLNILASSTEEMNATINEIASNAGNATTISDKAVEQAKSAYEKIGHLGKAAVEIGKVTETISEISEQTNLLALNATIEAARAGEAGKGFAVVAAEIKELARQTADATLEIKKSIEGIQDVSSESVSEIESVSKIIGDVNSIISSIAAAIEEQSIATRESSENIAQASLGVQEVNENTTKTSDAARQIADDIKEVNSSTEQISLSNEKLSDSAAQLHDLFKELSDLMTQFKV